MNYCLVSSIISSRHEGREENSSTLTGVPVGIDSTIVFINDDTAYACTWKPVKFGGGGGVSAIDLGVKMIRPSKVDY